MEENSSSAKTPRPQVQDAETAPPKHACPNCGHGVPSAALYAKAASESRIAFKITPAPGELFMLKTLAGTLDSFGKLLELAGRQVGERSVPMLENVERNAETGEVTVTVLVLRGAKLKARDARRKAAASRRSGEKG